MAKQSTRAIATVLLTLLALAFGANLRPTETQAKTPTTSATDMALVEKLAIKYDCRTASGDLATSIASIIAVNAIETNTLLFNCNANKTTIATALSLAQREYNFKLPALTLTAKRLNDNAMAAAMLAYNATKMENENKIRAAKRAYQDQKKISDAAMQIKEETEKSSVEALKATAVLEKKFAAKKK